MTVAASRVATELATTRPAPDPTTLPLRTDAAVQGNVLASFDKDHQMLLLVHLPDRSSARRWLAELAPMLASNADVVAFNAEFSRRRRDSGSDPADMSAVWLNVSFTAPGIGVFDTGALTAPAGGWEPAVQPWIDGASSPTVLDPRTGEGDGSDQHWLFGRAGAARPVHAIVCVAADRRADLNRAIDEQWDLCARTGTEVVFQQPGAVLSGPSHGHEHFGFKDGISQPGISGFDPIDPANPADPQVLGKPGTDVIAAGNFALGYPLDDSTEGVPVPAWMHDGSFLVTRRMAQNVPGFWHNMTEEYETVRRRQGNDAATRVDSAEELAARLVGRYRNGSPTDKLPQTSRPDDPSTDNDFNFAADPHGDLTPQCAHIRKVYPRSGADHEGAFPRTTEDDTRKHRLLRRGITYGAAFEPTAGPGHGVETERGLVFQCYQSSLADGFIFIQRLWVDDVSFPEQKVGNDAVIGRSSKALCPAGGKDVSISLTDWISIKGTVFSLTPSLRVVHALADGTPLSSLPAETS